MTTATLYWTPSGTNGTLEVDWTSFFIAKLRLIVNVIPLPSFRDILIIFTSQVTLEIGWRKKSCYNNVIGSSMVASISEPECSTGGRRIWIKIIRIWKRGTRIDKGIEFKNRSWCQKKHSSSLPERIFTKNNNMLRYFCLTYSKNTQLILVETTWPILSGQDKLDAYWFQALPKDYIG